MKGDRTNTVLGIGSLLLFFLCPFVASAQNVPIRFHHITQKDGLSQNSVFSILQDKRGFVWFATEDGLNRYNGYEFQVFKNDPDDPTSISDNFIFTIFEDNNQDIWFGTNNGLDKFDFDNDRFIRQPGIACPIKTLVQDEAGRLWLGTINSIIRFDPKTWELKRFVDAPDSPYSLHKNNVKVIVHGDSGLFWIGTFNKGLVKYHPQSGQFTRYIHEPDNPNSIANDNIWTVFKDTHNYIWIGTNKGLSRLDPATDEIANFLHDPDDPTGISSNKIRFVYEDRLGTLWVGTHGGGLNRYDRKTGTFKSYRHSRSDPDSISIDYVMSLYEDKLGTLWIGTDLGGVNSIDQHMKKFSHFNRRDDGVNTLSNNIVWALLEDRRGNAWIGTQNGLNELNLQTKAYRHYYHDPDKPGSLSNDRVNTLLEDNEGDIWIGTNDGLNRLNPATGEIKSYFRDDTDGGLSSSFVMSLAKDEENNIWIGTTSGLNKLDPADGTITTVYNNNEGVDFTSTNTIRYVFADSRGAIWTCTDGAGLNRFDPKTAVFTAYQADPRDTSALSSNFVWSINEDRRGYFWIGTAKGLNRLDPGSGRFTVWNEKNGLPNSVIYGVLIEYPEGEWGTKKDRDPVLWMSTNKGLVRFNPETQTFRHYDSSDGLQNDEFNARAFFKAQSSRMYFGGINGFNYFHPKEIKDNPFVPKVVFTDFQIFNNPVDIGKMYDGRIILQKSISETAEITLSYKHRVFSIEFAALHYAAPQKNEYAYRMENFETNWNYSKDRRFATYTNLSAGEYSFHVKASNNDKIWNDQGSRLRIVIVPPFWATIWFRIALIACTLLVIVALHRLRTRFVLRQNEKLERIDRLISIARLGTSMAHEINNPLFAIANSIQVIKKKIKDTELGEVAESVELAETEIKRVRAIIDKLNDYTKINTTSFVKTGIEKILSSSLSVLKWGRRLHNVSIDIVPKNKSFPIYCNPDSMQQVFMNLIINSIESMNGDGEIRIEIGEKKHFYHIHFFDSGPGFDAMIKAKLFEPFISGKENGSGLGLFISNNIIKKHKGEIVLDDKYSGGAHIIVKMPKGDLSE